MGTCNIAISAGRPRSAAMTSRRPLRKRAMLPKVASARTLHITLLYVLAGPCQAGAVRQIPSSLLPVKVACLCPRAGQHLPPPRSLATRRPSSGMPTANNLVGFFQRVPQHHWPRCTHSVPPTRASNVNSGSFHVDGAKSIQPGSCGCPMTAAKP